MRQLTLTTRRQAVERGGRPEKRATVVQTHTEHWGSPVAALLASADGRRVCAASADGTVTAWTPEADHVQHLTGPVRAGYPCREYLDASDRFDVLDEILRRGAVLARAQLFNLTIRGAALFHELLESNGNVRDRGLQ